MKIAINVAYGGFSLSALAVKRWAELQGRSCFFFKQKDFQDPYTRIDFPVAPNESWQAFYIPNPNEFFKDYEPKHWHTFSLKKKKELDQEWESLHINRCPTDRTDPCLIQAIEELGEKANGYSAELKIVEIPDDVLKWEITEYDGKEIVEEIHRVWD